MASEWDLADQERLRAYWNAGHSTAEIGRRMGMSKNAIVGKAHRMGLSRPSPIITGGASKPPKAPRILAVKTLPALASLKTVVQAERKVVAPASPPQFVISSRPCCWPLWGNERPALGTHRFCGAAGIPGRPYCPEHTVKARAGSQPAEMRL